MKTQTTTPPATDGRLSETIPEDDFRALIASRSARLLAVASRLSRQSSATSRLGRPLLGELLHQSTEVEELLDAYGSRTNRRWNAFRSVVAAIKLFADVSYELLHIEHVVPSYRLPAIEERFAAATEEAIDTTWRVLLRAADQTLAQAKRLYLPIPPEEAAPEILDEELPGGRLLSDMARRGSETVSETVTRLATAFLNLAADSRLLHAPAKVPPPEYPALVPDPVSEESLRALQHRFHNCQSLYDTHVSGTEAEALDPDLRVLRGYVSVVLHLLRTATAFAHYYERHVTPPMNGSASSASARFAGGAPAAAAAGATLITGRELLNTLMDYSIRFASRYLTCGEQLCRQMLRHYAEVIRITAPVPRYRGFHVRPSTLVAKIVQHYGSEVKMEIDGDTYDAGSPLEIFRVNEKINARKRRWLGEEMSRLSYLSSEWTGTDVKAAVRHVMAMLLEQGKLVLYEQPLQLPDDLFPAEGEPAAAEGLSGPGTTLLSRVTAVLARLQAVGKIDIEADLTVDLVGDKRVLADIKLLAENGYGEDNFGNNIALPEKLRYLRR